MSGDGPPRPTAAWSPWQFHVAPSWGVRTRAFPAVQAAESSSSLFHFSPSEISSRRNSESDISFEGASSDDVSGASSGGAAGPAKGVNGASSSGGFSVSPPALPNTRVFASGLAAALAESGDDVTYDDATDNNNQNNNNTGSQLFSAPPALSTSPARGVFAQLSPSTGADVDIWAVAGTTPPNDGSEYGWPVSQSAPTNAPTHNTRESVLSKSVENDDKSAYLASIDERLAAAAGSGGSDTKPEFVPWSGDDGDGSSWVGGGLEGGLEDEPSHDLPSTSPPTSDSANWRDRSASRSGNKSNKPTNSTNRTSRDDKGVNGSDDKKGGKVSAVRRPPPQKGVESNKKPAVRDVLSGLVASEEPEGESEVSPVAMVTATTTQRASKTTTTTPAGSGGGGSGGNTSDRATSKRSSVVAVGSDTSSTKGESKGVNVKDGSVGSGGRGSKKAKGDTSTTATPSKANNKPQSQETTTTSKKKEGEPEKGVNEKGVNVTPSAGGKRQSGWSGSGGGGKGKRVSGGNTKTSVKVPSKKESESTGTRSIRETAAEANKKNERRMSTLRIPTSGQYTTYGSASGSGVGGSESVGGAVSGSDAGNVSASSVSSATTPKASERGLSGPHGGVSKKNVRKKSKAFGHDALTRRVEDTPAHQLVREWSESAAERSVLLSYAVRAVFRIPLLLLALHAHTLATLLSPLMIETALTHTFLGGWPQLFLALSTTPHSDTTHARVGVFSILALVLSVGVCCVWLLRVGVKVRRLKRKPTPYVVAVPVTLAAVYVSVATIVPTPPLGFVLPVGTRFAVASLLLLARAQTRHPRYIPSIIAQFYLAVAIPSLPATYAMIILGLATLNHAHCYSVFVSVEPKKRSVDSRAALFNVLRSILFGHDHAQTLAHTPTPSLRASVGGVRGGVSDSGESESARSAGGRVSGGGGGVRKRVGGGKKPRS